MKTRIAPSLMCMDLLKVPEQLAFFEKRIHFYHVDIMDGHFVPNLTLSPSFIAQIRPHTKVAIDAHLMVTTPGNFIESCAKAGADYITMHAETLSAVGFRNIKMIRDLGKKPALAINPETTLESTRHYLNLVDKVTIMTVDPGFAAQPFVPEMLEKIEELVAIRKKRGLNLLIEIDGSCNKNTYERMIKAGAEVLVMGSTGLFGIEKTLELSWERMEKELTEAEKAAGIA